MLLPLKLTSWEELQVLDDYPAYPNCIFGRFRFEGKFDSELADRAVEIGLERHPLLRAIVSKQGRKKVWTEPKEKRSHIFKFKRDEVDDYAPMPGVDLKKEPCARTYMVQDDNSSDITFQVHHGCCDGIAAVQGMIDWMLAYDQLCKDRNKSPKLRRVSIEDLKTRGDYGFKSLRFLKMLHRQLIGLGGIYEFAAHTAASLVPNSRVDEMQPAPANYPQAITHEFDENASLHQVAAIEKKVTTNELFIRDLFLAINKFRKKHGFSRPEDWVRIVVPMNMREMKHRRLPAANRVSIVSFDRRPAANADPDRLLGTIRGQMNIIQQNSLGLTFHAIINASKWLPGGLRRLARKDLCTSTCLLTNLGEPLSRINLPKDEKGHLRVGNLTLKGFDLLAPLRPNTNASFTVFRYAGKYCVTMNYDPRALSKDLAREFLNFFVSEIQNSQVATSDASQEPNKEKCQRESDIHAGV